MADGTLAEVVYRPAENRTLFCVHRNAELRYVPELHDRGERLVPYKPSNALLRTGVVLFPSAASEYGTEAELVAEIQSYIHRYVDLSPLFEQVATYYVLFSWVYDGFNELPYLRVRGDAGSGKTRFLLTVGSICYKPFFASAASTVSPLFRIMDVTQGTLVVDEGDFRVSDEKAELIKILNNGNGRGFPVLRTEALNSRELVPRAYNVFGPKLIATRGYFQDRALESRCLTEEMGGRPMRAEVPIHLDEAYRAEALQLRNKLLLFRFRNFGHRAIDSTLIDRSVEPRLSQVFVPLMSVVSDTQVRGSLQAILRQLQREIVADRGLDIEASVLEVLQELQGDSRTLELAVADVARLMSERHGDNFGRKITPHWVGHLVRRQLGLKTERRAGGFVIPGTEGAKLARLWERYGFGMNSVNFVNSGGDTGVDDPVNGKAALL